MKWLDMFTRFYLLGAVILSIMTVSLWVFGPLAPAFKDVLADCYFVVVPAWFLLSIAAIVLFRRSVLLLASPVSFVIWLAVVFRLAWETSLVVTSGNRQQVLEAENWIPLCFNAFALFYGTINWMLFLKSTK